MVKMPRILYFIDGPAPNAANQLEANGYRGKGATVAFRNTRHLDTEATPEPCDGVMGAVPDAYKLLITAGKLKTAEDAMGAYNVAVEKEQTLFAAQVAAAGGVQDNLGTHTVSRLAQVPVAASARPADTTAVNTPVPVAPTPVATQPPPPPPPAPAVNPFGTPPPVPQV